MQVQVWAPCEMVDFFIQPFLNKSDVDCALHSVVGQHPSECVGGESAAQKRCINHGAECSDTMRHCV